MVKKVVAIIAFVVIASLSIASCTTSTTNQTPSASATPALDAFLEKYLAEYKNTSYSHKDLNFTAWELTWINGTSARVEYTYLNKTSNNTWNLVETFVVFPTSQDAEQYLNAMNKTGYNLTSTEYTSGGAYLKATGHAPQIYKKYEWLEGTLGQSGFTSYGITQLDNIIMVSTAKMSAITTQRVA
jgi:hypothetical protein